MTRHGLIRMIAEGPLKRSVKRGVNTQELARDIVTFVEKYYSDRLVERVLSGFSSSIYDESPDFPEGS
jgi:hypothetical protein